jgi:hypothetical protein
VTFTAGTTNVTAIGGQDYVDRAPFPLYLDAGRTRLTFEVEIIGEWHARAKRDVHGVACERQRRGAGP